MVDGLTYTKKSVRCTVALRSKSTLVREKDSCAYLDNDKGRAYIGVEEIFGFAFDWVVLVSPQPSLRDPKLLVRSEHSKQ